MGSKRIFFLNLVDLTKSDLTYLKCSLMTILALVRSSNCHRGQGLCTAWSVLPLNLNLGEKFEKSYY